MNELIPQDSELQIKVNRRPFTAGRNMLPDAAGTFDVSLDWPLPLQLNHLTVVLAPATIDYKVLARPKKAFHAMVVRSSLTLGAATANDQFRLIFRRSSDVVGIQTDDLILSAFDGNNGNVLPLIGGAYALNIFQPIGVKPVYVPAGYDCGVLQFSNAGDTSQLNWLVLEYPETQPLTTLGEFY